jgi:hypothetical protein
LNQSKCQKYYLTVIKITGLSGYDYQIYFLLYCLLDVAVCSTRAEDGRISPTMTRRDQCRPSSSAAGPGTLLGHGTYMYLRGHWPWAVRFSVKVFSTKARKLRMQATI